MPGMRSVAMPFIPPRFATRVAVHAYVGGHSASQSPLILGIHGRPGYGKSFQVREVARMHGFHFSAVSAGGLASTLESKPVEMLESRYVQLAVDLARCDLAGFLLIDDFDLGIAAIRTNATYTVNSQLLIAFLMSLCDDPLMGGRLRRPVPIIVTGNNLRVLYAPLTRHGRMETFEWLPTPAELKQIVERMIGLHSSDVAWLLEEFRNQPVSFFRQLVVEVWRTNVAAALGLTADRMPHYSEFHASVRNTDELSLEVLLRTGWHLLEHSRLVDHLLNAEPEVRQ